MLIDHGVDSDCKGFELVSCGLVGASKFVVTACNDLRYMHQNAPYISHPFQWTSLFVRGVRIVNSEKDLPAFISYSNDFVICQYIFI